MKKILRGKDGYVLTWVICIFLIITIISTVIVSSAVISTQSVMNDYTNQQVYYTAKSAASAVADYIIKNSASSSVMQKLTAGNGTGTISGMGDYDVDVSYVSTDKIKVKATATYQGQTASATVYVIHPPAPSGIIPTDNVLYINGAAASGLGQCNLLGSVYINGPMTLTYGSAIKGFCVVNGNTTITGAGNTTNGLFSFGNTYLDNSGTISGDLFTKGDLKMLGSARVTGKVYADGSLNMSDGSSYIADNTILGKNASFGGGDNRIGGTLTYSGAVSYSYGSITTFVPKGAIKASSYAQIDESKYTSQALPVISTPTITAMPGLYKTVTITNNTISDSGTIDASVMSQLNQLSWGSTVTIDATTKDINLLLNNTNYSTINHNSSKGLKFEVNSDGTHNVFIYMTGSSSITVGANEYFGMKVRSSNPRLFIFGDGAQTVNILNNSELNACIYIPQGTLNASGSPLTTYKFVGACIVKSASIDSNVSFFYSKPYLANTPLSIFSSGGTSSVTTAWKIESWGTN